MIEPKNAMVVIIEDNADNFFIASELLRRQLGVTSCIGWVSGRQFFKWLESNPTLKIDVILLDIQLPHKDGYEVLKQIHDQPRLHSTTVVAVTANSMPHHVARAREAGFDGFIGKPIDPKRFPDQVRRILAGDKVWEPI